MPGCAARPQITIRPELYIGVALAVMLIPIRWLFAWMLATAVHELSHYLCLQLCGCRVFGIQIGWNGAVIDSQFDSWGREVLCALAGPVGGCLLLLTAQWLPRAALCALFQTAYNLLPVYPLDGGRAMYAALCRCLPEQSARRITNYLAIAILSVFAAVSLYMTFTFSLGLLPLIFVGLLYVKIRKNTLKTDTFVLQ